MKVEQEKLGTVAPATERGGKPVKEDKPKKPKDIKDELDAEAAATQVKDRKRPGRTRNILIKEEQK